MMNYTFMPSLEHMAITKTVITLWNQDDIRDLTAKFDLSSFQSERLKWQEIEDKVIKKVPQLSQPEPLKAKILGFIKPVGVQMLKWMDYHDENCYSGIRLPNELCWTPHGTVHQKKTAEALIKNESLDIERRYKLACFYCLEDDIPKLWNKMPKNRRKYFYNKEDPRKVRQNKLVVLWTYDIKGEVAKLDDMIERWENKCSPYQKAFEYAASCGNRAATEYFLQKLIPQERKESLVSSAGYVVSRRESPRNLTDILKEHHTDVLCFLLSKMNEEQQIEVIKICPYKVLKCLLDWPWQSLCMEMANRMWDFVSGENYFYLFLRRIIRQVRDGYKDYNYQKLFGEFWEQNPDAYKRYAIGRCTVISYGCYQTPTLDGCCLLKDLLKIEDKENVRLILKTATVKEKEEIIFHYNGMDICEMLIYRNKWDLLKFFVQECISFKDVIIKFKEEFKKCITHDRSEEELEKEKDMWSKVFQLLDDLAQENNEKRSMEEGESSSAKRLHSI